MTGTATDLPSWSGAAHARNLASTALRLTYRLHPHGMHHVGTSDPVVAVCRCEGVLAGAVIHATVPRPVHVVANEAMMAALRQGMMTKAGVIPVADSVAVTAQRAAHAAVLDDRAVVLTGSLVDPSYLIAVTGAPLVPLVLLGAEGRVATDPPRPRSRIDVYCFEPVPIAIVGDPLRTSTRAAVDEQVRQALADAENLAAIRSGRG